LTPRSSVARCSTRTGWSSSCSCAPRRASPLPASLPRSSASSSCATPTRASGPDSARYSVDIDLDVLGVAGRTLENKVDGVLSSQPLEFILRSIDLAVVAPRTSPSQSRRTRRDAGRCRSALPDRASRCGPRSSSATVSIGKRRQEPVERMRGGPVVERDRSRWRRTVASTSKAITSGASQREARCRQLVDDRQLLVRSRGRRRSMTAPASTTVTQGHPAARDLRVRCTSSGTSPTRRR